MGGLFGRELLDEAVTGGGDHVELEAALRLTTLEVEEFGDSATEVGTLSGSLGATELTGKYIALWSQTNAGWTLHRDIWNFDA